MSNPRKLPVPKSKYNGGDPFTAEEIQTVITRAAGGYSVYSTAVILERSAPGVREVVKRYQERIEVEKENLAEMFEGVARRAILHVSDEKLAAASARDLGILAGVSVDKQRLIAGLSTENHLVLHAAACFSSAESWGNGHIDGEVVEE
jgi:hypothetical protein